MLERSSATTQVEAADAIRSERAARGIPGLDEILGGGLVSVIEKRIGGHERAIRELLLEPGRLDAGEELRDVLGIISGELQYQGGEGPLLDAGTGGA